MLRSPEASTGRLGAVLRAVGSPGPLRLAPGGPWLATTLDQARAVLADPDHFDFPMDVSRRPVRRPRSTGGPTGARGPRTSHTTTPSTTREQVAAGRAVFAASLDAEVAANAGASAELDADLILRRPVARATTAALLGRLDESARDAVADAVLAWIDALAPVISSPRNPSRWSRVRRAETRTRNALEALLADVGVEDPSATATVLAAGIQVPIAAGAWLLVHLAATPASDEPYDPAHVAWETIRVTPPTWVTARLTSAATRLADTELAAGEVVLVSPLLLGQLPALVPTVTSPPDVFDPDRWRRDDIRPGAWLPFGAGPHACPGRSLGLALLTDLARCAARWDLVSAAPAAIDQSRGLFPVPARVGVRVPGAETRP
ncbi:cytochrome P450 [Nocardioides sp. SOB77]|uniref:Cytochrome P450 n=1 Tax=Nocardioides oceani TaxID=3058369 RepID=A0ABT8FB16_9ACTN|nr:cytochrome P450 [Nocardioides oceani]MDN4171886.1 cytochrome P450 [Nocardioides oceani]